jgi:hypothetical protein
VTRGTETQAGAEPKLNPSSIYALSVHSFARGPR